MKPDLSHLPILNGPPRGAAGAAAPLPVNGPAWVVDESDPAALSAVQKICAAGIRPGIIFKLTADEFAAVKAGKLARIL